MDLEEVTVTAGGLEFNGIAAGRGRPALLLHGFPDTPHSFRHQIEALGASGYRAFAPAMRGYPPTGGGGPYDVGRLAADAIELLEAMGATPAEKGLLIGHDWGGMAAYAAAASRPDLLDRIVSMSVPHPTMMAAKLFSGDYDQLRRSWYMFLFQLPGISEAAVSANDFAFLERLMLDWSPRLRELEGDDEIERRKEVLGLPGALTAALSYYRAMFATGTGAATGPVDLPTLVVFGADDGCIAPSICDGMEALFPAGLTFEVVDGAGHFVQSEMAEQVTDLVLEFVN